MHRIAPPAALGNTDGRRFLSRRRRGCACPPAGVCSKKQPAPSSPLAKHSSVSVPVASPWRACAGCRRRRSLAKVGPPKGAATKGAAARPVAKPDASMRPLPMPPLLRASAVGRYATHRAAPRRAPDRVASGCASLHPWLAPRLLCAMGRGHVHALVPSTAGHFRRRVGMIIRARWRMVRHAASAMSARESEAMRLSRLDEWLKAQSSLHSEAPQPWPAPPFTHPLPHVRTHAHTHSRRGRNPLLHGHMETSGQILLRLGRCIFSISSARSRRSGRLSIARRRRCAVCEPCMHGV